MIALRVDDVGASTKKYEVYSNHTWKIGRQKLSANWLFLKYLPPFKKWGPYREMGAREWYYIFDLLEKSDAKLTVAVTASWAESEHDLKPFPSRFPNEAAALKEGLQNGLIEIANHGLTHCVLKNNVFKPRWFSSNRRYHREFWDWVPLNIQEKHKHRSQDILQTFFHTGIVSFVPPGNVFTDATLELAQRCGLRYVSCSTEQRRHNGITIIGDENVLPFHDRDIVFNGIEWLRRLIEKQKDRQFCFIKELGENFLSSARKGDMADL